MSRINDVYWVQTQQLALNLGVTLASYMSPNPGQNSWIVKNFSGGTLQLIGATLGMTLTAAQLNTANGTGYVFGSSEVLAIAGPAAFYLAATGATCTAHITRGYGPSTG